MPDAPVGTVTQIATELGFETTMPGRWRRKLRRQPQHAFVGNGDRVMKS
jgi:transposase-like protein